MNDSQYRDEIGFAIVAVMGMCEWSRSSANKNNRLLECDVSVLSSPRGRTASSLGNVLNNCSEMQCYVMPCGEANSLNV